MTDLKRWLETLGLEKYAGLLADNDVDLDVLAELTEADLEKLGIPLGARKKLIKAVCELNGGNSPQLDRHRNQTHTAAALGAERRQITVMFCDLVGSTALSTALDPEDYRSVITSFQKTVSNAVRRFEGQVAKYLGDGVLACFGYPVAHEDDSERAVRGALATMEAVHALRPHHDLRLEARIGIATGLVVAGDIAEDGVSEAGALSGEALNLAARLQALAAPGTILIDRETLRQTGETFACDALEPQLLKGIAEPVTAWRVTGERHAASRFDARHATHLGPFVGRAEELDLLLRRWNRATQGEGQVVLISGEPGIGKSRLAETLHEQLEGEPHTRLRFQCSPYHVTSALYPVITQLSLAAGFEGGDPLDLKLDKLETLLKQAVNNVRDVAPLIANLLLLPVDGRYPPINLLPSVQKARTFDALREQLLGLAHREPLLLVFEDLHWLDPSSQELLDLLIEPIKEARVLALLTFRPEYRPPWVGQAQVSLLSLSRLDRRASIELVRGIAEGHVSNTEAIEQVAAKADGIPLYMEELARGLFESDSGSAVPPSIQATVLGRLDRLGPAKRVAQIGAVIGREFSNHMIAMVSGLPQAELNEGLRALTDSGLLHARGGTAPEAVYAFKHALVRDAAYESLVKTSRRPLHAAVASALEKAGDGVVAPTELLAFHVQRAEDHDRAADLWLNAGRMATARSALLEAIAHFTNGLDQLARLPESPARARRELLLQNSLGVAYFLAKGYASMEAGRAYARAQELAEVADQVERFATLWGLWLHNLVRADFGRSRAAAEKIAALTSTGPRGDAESEMLANGTLAICDFFTGNLETADQQCAAVFARYDYQRDHARFPPRYGFDFAPILCAYQGCTRFLLGFPDQARKRGDQTFELAQGHDHPFSKARVYWWSALVSGLYRDWAAVRRRCDLALAAMTDQSFPLVMAGVEVLQGAAMAESGEAAAIAHIRHGIVAYEETGARYQATMFEAFLAEALLRTGEPEASLEVLRHTGARIEATGETVFAAEILRLKGNALLALGSEDGTAELAYNRAIDIAKSQCARSLELRATRDLASLWRARGRNHDGRALLAPLFAWFTEGFDTPDLVEAKALFHSPE